MFRIAAQPIRILISILISANLLIAQAKQIPTPPLVHYTANPTILDIQFVNPKPTFDTSAQWSKPQCSNNVWLTNSSPRWEWMPVLDPSSAAEDKPVGIVGLAQKAETSGNSQVSTFGDVWFDHPFGSDFDLDVGWAANPNQDFLVAPDIAPDADQTARNAAAINTFGAGGKAIHVEMETGLLPSAFRPSVNDSVAVWGRWIVDCGHPVFQSEIHPPLMLVKATRANDLTTQSTVITRPFLVGQDFGGDGLFDYLVKQLGQLVAGSIAGGPWALLQPPLSARTNILTTPFTGLHIFIYKLRPPVQQPAKMKLFVSYHFTVKSSVAVQLTNVGDADGTVMMTVVMNQIGYKAATLPQRTNMNVPLSQIEAQENLGPYIKGAQAGGSLILANPFASIVLQKGVDTDQYTLPAYTDPPDIQRFADSLPGVTEVTVDDTQPYPLRGSIQVNWMVDPATIGPITIPGKNVPDKQ
jgi:hypothetical protein